MKRIILVAMAVLLFTQPALAYTRLFYRLTVRSNYVNVELPTDTPAPTDTPLPDPSTIPPAEEGLSDEDGLVDEVELGGEDGLIVEESGVEDTPEPEGSASAVIGPPEGVELVDTFAQSSIPPDLPAELPAQPSILPAVEENMVDVEVAGDEVFEEQSVENTPEEIEPAQDSEQNPAQEPEQRITTPAEAGE